VAYCTKCGTKWPEDVHFCGKCGVPLLTEPDDVHEQSVESIMSQQPPEFIATDPGVPGDESTTWDELTSPIKMLVKYLGITIGLVILGFVGLIAAIYAADEDRGFTGLLKLVIGVAALFSMYKILKMPESDGGINNPKKLTSIIVIGVVVYLTFTYLGDGDGEDDNRGGHYLEEYAHDIRNADYSSACSVMMESDGQFLSGDRLQSCIDEWQNECGSDGCRVTLSVLDTNNTGEKTNNTGYVFAYKVRVSSESEGGASWCETWYGAKNLESGRWGAPLDSFITENGSEFSNGKEVSC